MNQTRTRRLRGDSGFTLVETLVGMVITVAVVAAGLAFVLSQSNTQIASAATRNQQSAATDAIGLVNRDIANAQTLLYGAEGDLVLQGVDLVDAAGATVVNGTSTAISAECGRLRYVIEGTDLVRYSIEGCEETYAHTGEPGAVNWAGAASRRVVLSDLVVNGDALFSYLDENGVNIPVLPVRPGAGSESVALIRTNFSAIVDARTLGESPSVGMSTDTAIDSSRESFEGDGSPQGAYCPVNLAVVTGAGGAPKLTWAWNGANPASFVVLRDGKKISNSLTGTTRTWTDAASSDPQQNSLSPYAGDAVANYQVTASGAGGTSVNCPARIYAPPAGRPLLTVPVSPTGVTQNWATNQKPTYNPLWTPVDGAETYTVYRRTVQENGSTTTWIQVGTPIRSDSLAASNKVQLDGVDFLKLAVTTPGDFNQVWDWKVVTTGRKAVESGIVTTRSHMTSTITAVPTTYNVNTVTWTKPPVYLPDSAVVRYEIHRYSDDPDAAIAPISAANRADQIIYAGKATTVTDNGNLRTPSGATVAAPELGSTYRYYVVVVSRVGSDGILSNGPKSAATTTLQFPPSIRFTPDLSTDADRTPYQKQSGSSMSNVRDGDNLVMWMPSKSAVTYDIYRFRYDDGGNRFGDYQTVAERVSGSRSAGRVYYDDRSGIALGSQWRYAVVARNATGISPGPDNKTAARVESIKTSDNAHFMYVTQRPSGSSIQQKIEKNAVYRTESYNTTERYYDVGSASWKERTVTRSYQVVDYYDVTVRWNENGDAGNPSPYKFCNGVTSDEQHTSFCKYEVSKNNSVVASSLGANEYRTRLSPGENATFTVRSCNSGGCSDASASAEIPRDQLGGFAVTNLVAPNENIFVRTGTEDYKNSDGYKSGLVGSVEWSAASGAVKYKWGRDSGNPGDGRSGETRSLSTGPVDMYPDRAYTYTVVACATEACPDSDPANRRITSVIQAPPGHPRYVSTIQQCQREKNDDGVGNSKWKLALHLDNRPLEGNLSGTVIAQFERNSDQYSAGGPKWVGTQIGQNANIDLLTGEMGKGSFEPGVQYSEAWWAIQNYSDHASGVIPSTGYSYDRAFGLSAGSNNPWLGQCRSGDFGPAPMNQNNYPNSFPDITKWEARR